MVLAELAGGVAEVLQQAADRRIELAHAHRRAGEADLGQPGADAVLAGEERRAAGGAALLAVVVQEANAFLGDAVDVGRLVAHQAVAVGADVGDADVVAEDDEDVRFLGPVAVANRRHSVWRLATVRKRPSTAIAPLDQHRLLSMGISFFRTRRIILLARSGSASLNRVGKYCRQRCFLKLAFGARQYCPLVQCLEQRACCRTTKRQSYRINTTTCECYLPAHTC